jgi:hypothetical protein
VCLAVGIIGGAAAASAQSISVPGTIEVENFDQGSSGVAYYDSSSGNRGEQYRATDVDIEACAEGGFNVGWVAAGEWLRYTVNVSQAGTYTLEFRVAAETTGGTFHLEVNGADRTGPIQVPATGGWQTWATVRKTGVSLNAGSQTWRLVFDTTTGGVIGNFNYIRVTREGTSSSSTPYTGTAVALPGTVQSENFDNGGEGVAYHDLSPENEGGQYRSSGVDIEAASDTGGGYGIGWALEGEWLAYTVNVASAGTYDIEVRVASSGAGGTFHIDVNGVNRTGSFTVPDTGGWQNWVTLRKSGLTLSAGTQVFKLVLDSSGPGGAVGNFNYMRVTAGGSSGGSGSSNAYGGTPVALPGTIQAENFDNGGEGVGYHDLYPENEGGQYRSTGVDVETTTDSGGGYSVGYAFAGEWLAYTVNVPTAGTYDIEVRVASSGNGGTFHIDVNGSNRTGSFTVPSTGGWQTWSTIRKTGLSLSAGQQVWRLVMDTNGPTGAVGNFNYIRVVSAGGGGNQPPSVSLTGPANGVVYTAPANIYLSASASDSDGTVTRVDFYANGTLLGSDTSSPYNYYWPGAGAATYTMTAVAYDNSGASTTSAGLTVIVSGVSITTTNVVFNPSPDHATLVTSYRVALYRSSDPATATPAASKSLGKPAPVNNEISASISDIVNPLPAGSYYAVVSAIGSAGSSSSTPSAVFTK